MSKTYIIFDLDGSLIKSRHEQISVIANYLCEKYNLDKEALLYFFQQTRGTALRDQLMNFIGVNKEQAQAIAQEVYELIRTYDGTTFFPGVVDTIKKLSKHYTLFLSTGNSTSFAEKKLTEAGIQDCFENILGSDIFLKGEEHIEQFKVYGFDDEAGTKTVFVGDGQKDRDIAKVFGYTFIHIDPELRNEYQDQYEIASVTEIESILSQL